MSITARGALGRGGQGTLGTLIHSAGRRADAARDGERGLELTTDEYFRSYVQQQLARIYMLNGNHDRALDLLEPLVRVPHSLSPGWFRIDPTWDPLRWHPLFKKLVEGT